ncbi:Flavin oxidoreductase hxnT [Colletotrichum trifolii]|uniref:Flavin oxidoreductase hxnT n=1 Tax=Colletotrichum trifolii TaxID=5466 RepID=A0A4R8QMN5_COLTR|nr:Flavin oxidoreductase hxnT [Colletotrichum trifolii]
MSSDLFQPLPIANGRITLQHRVVMAPMTRNRGVPLSDGTPEGPNRTWLPDKLVALYYAQRASPGGLLITEGIPPSIEASGMPNVPGMFHPAQIDGWKHVVDGVHAKGGFIYAQLWHAGRATMPQMTGLPTVSSSATPWEDDEKYPFRIAFTKEKVSYRNHPPRAMTEEDIERTANDFVRAAQTAMDIGFDGVEINGGNGNLLDQFLHSNINTRTDAYGGSLERRAKFPLDVMAAIAKAIGPSNVAIRLEPAGLYNHTRGAEACPSSPTLRSGPSFQRFRRLPVADGVVRIVTRRWIKAGMRWCLQSGSPATPTLPARLQRSLPLRPYDRSRFYGSWDGVRERGYTEYLTYQEDSAAKTQE